MLIIDSIFLLPDVIALNYISMFMLISTGNVYVCFVICHGVIILRHMFMVELDHLYNQV